MNTLLDRTVNIHDSPYCHHLEAAVRSSFGSVLLTVLSGAYFLTMVSLIALCDYYLTVSVNLSIHVHHCDSSVLSHCIPQNGVTALMLASGSGHTDVVQRLLSSGPQEDLKDEVRHNINLTAMSLRIADTMFLILIENF